MDILSMEEFAFSLLNQLADEYGIFDDGSFARAIQETTDIKVMTGIIGQLQQHLLTAMFNSIPQEKPEFPFGEFDNGNHWQGVF